MYAESWMAFEDVCLFVIRWCTKRWRKSLLLASRICPVIRSPRQVPYSTHRVNVRPIRVHETDDVFIVELC